MCCDYQKPWWMTLGDLTAVFAITAVIMFLGSHYAAKHKANRYEQLTGKKIAQWDALFVDLNVVQPVKESK